ncbi:MAG: hypothetical protein CM15mP87_01480 [Candidatus Neomarinimicrobiota bacterium]|nr:MAG: hypothetical protein CM15mP87_01480 [Candidatus Neomarinimicrobiota bacterium]
MTDSGVMPCPDYCSSLAHARRRWSALAHLVDHSMVNARRAQPSTFRACVVVCCTSDVLERNGATTCVQDGDKAHLGEPADAAQPGCCRQNIETAPGGASAVDLDPLSVVGAPDVWPDLEARLPSYSR